jgi:regulatory protein SWI6
VFDHINETFSAELTAKQMSLNQTEQNVRHATRSLADKRQQMQRSQAALTELEQIKQKSENIRKALSLTTTLDWTGRTDSEAVSQAFKRIPAHVDQPTETNGHANGTDIQLPPQGQEGSVATLRRMREWEKRMRQVLEQRVQALEGEGLDKELKYRRLVSVCTKVPVEKVDGVSTFDSVGGRY